MNDNKTVKLVCGHCGNKTPHRIVFRHLNRKLFDETDEKKYYEEFETTAVICGTCEGVSLLGDFKMNLHGFIQFYPRLYPNSGKLGNGIPDNIQKIYSEIWSIKQTAPSAFVGQIRRALEYLCKDKKAKGKNLFEQLNSLINMKILPETIAEMTDLIRKVGNIGVHATEEDIDIWDADLIDDFFRTIVEYVYIAPEKVQRLKNRMSVSKTEN